MKTFSSSGGVTSLFTMRSPRLSGGGQASGNWVGDGFVDAAHEA